MSENLINDVAAFETHRMVAHQLCINDWAKIRAMHRDHETMKLIGGVRDDDQTREYFDLNIGHWNIHGYGIWLFHLRDTGEFVGRSGIRNTYAFANPEVELAYAVNNIFWGNGFATEMALSVINIGMKYFNFKNFIAYTSKINFGSKRIMDKLGFQFEKDIALREKPYMLYRFKTVALGIERQIADIAEDANLAGTPKISRTPQTSNETSAHTSTFKTRT